MLRTDANPQMVTLGRFSRGLTQAALASQVGWSQGTISKIEAGVESISGERLERLAQALDYPLHFFTKNERIDGPGITEIYHRKRQRAGATTLNKIHANAVIRRMNVETLLRSWDRLPDEDFPAFPIEEFEGNAEKIARTMRALWQIPPGPIFSMTTAIEAAGGIIIECDFETRHIDGFSRRNPGMPPLFFMNRNLLPDRWRWTLAHELAHIIIHWRTPPYDKMERDADLFAAEFLAPRHEIKPQLLNLTIGKLSALKQYWKISMQALLMRAYHLNVISDRKRRYMFMQLSKAGYRLREPSELDPPPEPPDLLHKIVKFHRDQLGYSDADLCQALAINERDLYSWYPPDDRRLHVVS